MSATQGQKPQAGLSTTKRADLEIAWSEREREASLLRAGGSRSMEICLRFYALEIRIKAIICQHLELDLLPEACLTHDLAKLLIFSGLHRNLIELANSSIQESWDQLAAYSKKNLNDLRYLPAASLSDEKYQALSIAFDDPTKGIHSWLSGLP